MIEPEVSKKYLTLAMYLIMTLLASVLPAPDSPDHYKNHYKITKSINSQFVT